MKTCNFSPEFRHRIFSSFLSLFILAFLSACNPSEDATGEVNPDDYNGNPAVYFQEAAMAEYVVFQDSFEREELLADPNINSILGYRGFIWDHGKPVVGTQGYNIKSVILDDRGKWGEASDGHKSLYMYGREGKSVHNIYLITNSFNLTNVDELEIEFDYISFRLNDPQDKKDGVDEYLKLEICTATPEECGVGTNLNSAKIKNGPWTSIFTHMPMDNSDQKFNGKNHKKRDWNTARVKLDITQFAHKEHFTFRFNARMTEGLHKNSTKFHFEDGVTIDNLRAKAVDYYDEDDSTPDSNDNDAPSDGDSDEGSDDDDGVVTPPVPDPVEECDAQGGTYLSDGICIIEIG